ncbi:putative transmembrane protein [Gregarina niphandrodes]|uniref:Transmembrane protein n=1 Tax=Gregarina niphandrodes TaxID=110365 RepID=A0A023B1D1_GRENI|nr:putative transmembrane protein [Gregarina niphandrodes]EZG47139.1 putative transmembrane protein [Gregarina niphandrodes]|eukprot:XP_011132205.1 putative transmembrane protein [Gregarina niphandrodes]
MPGFVSGAQMRVLLSFVLLFAGLFSLFLAVLIEHESSPKYSLRCIAFSNFVLTAPKIYDSVAPKLRSIFLSSVRTRGSLPLIDSQDTPGTVVSYKQGDIVVADCVVTSADYHARVSVPTFAQNQDLNHLSISVQDPAQHPVVQGSAQYPAIQVPAADLMASPTNLMSPAEDETMACVADQILYQGQQILSGTCVHTRVLQFSDLSLTRVLANHAKSASLTGAFWCYRSPRLKFFIRYFGTISIALFLAAWLARAALDPDREPDTDSFLINVLPRVTLTATLICQCLSSTTLYDSVDVLLLYAKQALGRKTAIVPHTVDLLRLAGQNAVTLDIGDQDLISSGLVVASGVSLGVGPTDEVRLESNLSGTEGENLFCRRGDLAEQVLAAQSVFSLRVTVASSSPRFEQQVTNTSLASLFGTWHLLPAGADTTRITARGPAGSSDATGRMTGGGLVIRLATNSVCMGAAYRKQTDAVFAALVSSRGYSTSDRNEIRFIEDLRGLIPLLYWTDVANTIYDRGTKFYVSSSASLALLALSTASYSTASDGVRLWVYTLAYFLLANSSLLIAILAMSFSLSLLRDSQISLDALLNVVRMEKSPACKTVKPTAKTTIGILGTQDLNAPPATSSMSNIIIDI